MQAAAAIRPLRMITWSEFDRDERELLLGRGQSAIFDKDLRRSVGEIVEDVRLHGDAAVLRALARFLR